MLFSKLRLILDIVIVLQCDAKARTWYSMPSYRKALPMWVLKLSSAASTWEMRSGSCFRCSDAEMALWILRVESLPWTEHSPHLQDSSPWHTKCIVSG